MKKMVLFCVGGDRVTVGAGFFLIPCRLVFSTFVGLSKMRSIAAEGGFDVLNCLHFEVIRGIRG